MKTQNAKWKAVLYLLPLLIHTGIFTLYPAVNTVILSFKEDYSLLSGTYSGLGTKNYQDIFSDTRFFQSISNTILYASVVVPVTILLAVMLAVFLNRKLKFSALFQTAFFLPMVTSATAVSYSMRLIFNSQYGILNALLRELGIPAAAWLTSSQYSMPVLMICGIWELLPFSILTVFGSLQNIDERYYLAAAVDGASRFTVFWKITLPFISRSIALLAVLHTISSFRVFDELFPLFSGHPGPSYNLYTLVYYMYEQMNTYTVGAYSRAAAVAVVLFFLLLGLSIAVALLRSTKAGAVRSREK